MRAGTVALKMLLVTAMRLFLLSVALSFFAGCATSRPRTEATAIREQQPHKHHSLKCGCPVRVVVLR